MNRSIPGPAKIRSDGYMRLRHEGKRTLEHLVIAEKVLGKTLPKGVEVHHVDFKRAHNSHSNLVICQDAAYHKLLHQRTRALDACGHADWRKCTLCKRYDAQENLLINSRNHVKHLACKREYERACYHARKTKQD